jgi:SAM-dependent methyltransferase
MVLQGWARRQETLRKWRNEIWESEEKADQRQVYLRWHWDFFRGFYEPVATPQARILDVGCGYMLKNFQQAGALQDLLERLGGRYTGIDPIDEWFTLQGEFPVELHQGMGEALPFADQSFDAVLHLGALDHAARPGRVLAEVHRVLRPGGTLWFANSFIQGSLLSVWVQTLRHWLGQDEHHRFVWTPRGLEGRIRRAGFNVVKTAYCSCDVSYYIRAERPGNGHVC